MNETDLHDAAADLADAADDVADATASAIDAPADAADQIDTTPIANAIGDAADQAATLDHESRLATLEANIANLAPTQHEHFDYARGDHEHVNLTDPPDVPVPDVPADAEPSDDEPSDEPPARTHPLLARPFAK